MPGKFEIGTDVRTTSYVDVLDIESPSDKNPRYRNNTMLREDVGTVAGPELRIEGHSFVPLEFKNRVGKKSYKLVPVKYLVRADESPAHKHSRSEHVRGHGDPYGQTKKDAMTKNQEILADFIKQADDYASYKELSYPDKKTAIIAAAKEFKSDLESQLQLNGRFVNVQVPGESGHFTGQMFIHFINLPVDDVKARRGGGAEISNTAPNMWLRVLVTPARSRSRPWSTCIFLVVTTKRIAKRLASPPSRAQPRISPSTWPTTSTV